MVLHQIVDLTILTLEGRKGGGGGGREGGREGRFEDNVAPE